MAENDHSSTVGCTQDSSLGYPESVDQRANKIESEVGVDQEQNSDYPSSGKGIENAEDNQSHIYVRDTHSHSAEGDSTCVAVGGKPSDMVWIKSQQNASNISVGFQKFGDIAQHVQLDNSLHGSNIKKHSVSSKNAKQNEPGVESADCTEGATEVTHPSASIVCTERKEPCVKTADSIEEAQSNYTVVGSNSSSDDDYDEGDSLVIELSSPGSDIAIAKRKTGSGKHSETSPVKRNSQKVLSDYVEDTDKLTSTPSREETTQHNVDFCCTDTPDTKTVVCASGMSVLQGLTSNTPSVSRRKHGDESDQSDSDIISLSEEDIFTEGTPNFVISNVCSLKDTYYNEKGKFWEHSAKHCRQELTRKQSDNDQDVVILEDLHSDSSGNKSSKLDCRGTFGKKDSDNDDVVILSSPPKKNGLGSSDKPASKCYQTGLQPAKVGRPAPVVIDFKELKQQKSAEFQMTGRRIEEKLSTLSSAVELLQAVSCLAAAEKAGESSNRDGMGMSVCLAPNQSTAGKFVNPFVYEATSTASISGCIDEGVNDSVSAECDLGIVNDTSSNLQLSAGGHSPCNTDTSSVKQSAESGVSPVSRGPSLSFDDTLASDAVFPPCTENLLSSSSTDVHIKAEPEDSGYETRSVTPSSAASSSSSVTSSAPSIISNKESSSTIKRPSCVWAQSGSIAAEDPPQKKKENILSRERKKERLDEVLNISADGGRTPTTTPTSSDVADSANTLLTNTPSAGGSVSDKPQSSRRKASAPSKSLHTMVVVPNTPQIMQPNTSPSIVLTIPALLPRNVATAASTSGSLVASTNDSLGKFSVSSAMSLRKSAVSTAMSSSFPVNTSAAGKAGVNSKVLSDTVLTHLHGIQGRPGTQQVLKIPMADGTMHTVKVIFAPPVQQPSTPKAASSASSVVSSAGSSAVSSRATISSVTKVVPGKAPRVVYDKASSVSGAASKQPVAISCSTPPVSLVVSSAASCVPVLVSSAVSSAPILVSSSILVNTLTAGSKGSKPSAATSNRKQTVLTVRPKPSGAEVMAANKQVALVEASSLLQAVASVSTSSTQLNKSKKLDLTPEGRISASDMASLIQGRNLIPTYRPPSDCPWVSSPTTTFRCTECGDTFATASGYSSHMKRMSMVVRYACMTCETVLVFFNKCTFLAHLRLHTSVEKQLGTVLNLRSYTMSVSCLPEALIPPTGDHHMDPLIVSQRTSTTCTECQTILPSTTQALLRHFGGEVTKCQYAHACSICLMELPTACSLKAHSRLHGSTKTISASPPFVCPECGLTYTSIMSLYQHLFATCLHFCRMVPVRCQICQQVSASRHTLEVHVAQHHSPQQSMLCLLCRQNCRLNSIRELHQHIKTEHGQPAGASLSALKGMYGLVSRCQSCKRDVDTDYVQTHMSNHVKDMMSSVQFAFMCMFCPKMSMVQSRRDLISHLTVSHNAYRFKCAICCLGFVSVAVLRVHVLSEHTMDKVQCQTCQCHILPEAALPHAMWHIMKDLNDGNLKGLDVPTPMDIRVTADGVKKTQKLLCRVCGLAVGSDKSLQKHLKKHLFRGIPVCCMCQRADFASALQAQTHLVECLRQSGQGQGDNATTEGESGKDGGESEVAMLGTSRQDGQSRPQQITTQKVGAPNTSAVKKRPLSSILPKMLPESTSQSKQPFTMIMKKKEKKKRKTLVVSSIDSSGDEAARSDSEDRIPRSQSPVQQVTTAEKPPNVPLYHPCHLCGLTYETKDTLMGHYASVHSGQKNVYFCLVCRKRGKDCSFSRKQLLVSHCMRKHRASAKEAEDMIRNETVRPLVQNTGQMFPMPVSTQSPVPSQPSTPDRSPIKRLRVIGNEQQEFVCAKCMFSAPSQQDFADHIAQHKVDNSVQCPECGLCFSVIPSLKKHLFMVHRIRQPQDYIDQHGIAVQALPDELVSHMNQFAPLGDHEFVIKVTRTPSYSEDTPPSKRAKKELIEDAKPSASMLECNVCYREFEDEMQLKAHMRTHGMAFIRSRRANARDSASN